MTKDQDRVYKESRILFSFPEISGSASSHAGAPFRLCKVIIIKSTVINSQRLYSLSLGILALSAERSSWLTPNSLNCGQHSAPVYISWSKLGGPCSLWVILCSRSYQEKWRHPGRTYANTVANMVCVSLHHRTHGEGEGLTASSPVEAVGRRRDPMGHLPFGRNPLRERILGVMVTFFGIRHSFPLGTIPAQAQKP